MNEVEQMTSRDHWAEDQTLPLGCLERIYDSPLWAVPPMVMWSLQKENFRPLDTSTQVAVGKERFVLGLLQEDL